MKVFCGGSKPHCAVSMFGIQCSWSAIDIVWFFAAFYFHI